MRSWNTRRCWTPQHTAGATLVYLGAYRRHGDPITAMSVDEQIALATPMLRALNADFDPAWIAERWSFAAPFAQPIVDRAFAASIPGFDSPVPGLFVENMFQVYPHDRGQNYSIELAERLVAHMELP